MVDPTYDTAAIQTKREWAIAFVLSEVLNDNAPLGWGLYIPAAEAVVRLIDEHTKPSIDAARAQKIVSAINNRALFAMGLVEITDMGSLNVDLFQMIEAKAIVEQQNDARRDKAAREGGPVTIGMVPDDRLIAAAYCMEHYPLDDEPILAVPMSREEAFHAGQRGGLKALAIVAVPPAEDDRS